MNLKNNDEKFSCVIVGGTSLPIRCAEILLQEGHHIAAVVTNDVQFSKWALKSEITVLDSLSHLLAPDLNIEFEYLFSIVNEHIVPEKILQLPRRFAINYHDSSLPRYAGTHATAWALINGERSHGITWHVIDKTVDAGDILKQVVFDIDLHDTSLTLNTKCYEAGIAAFRELVSELSAGQEVRTPQNPLGRTFYPRTKKPNGGGIICWKDEAERISSMVRALAFGDHPNKVGTAKVLIGDDFYIVKSVEVVENTSRITPGTIIACTDEYLDICCGEKALRIRELADMDGNTVGISSLAKANQLSSGTRLNEPEPSFLDSFAELATRSAKNEEYWVSTLSKADHDEAAFLWLRSDQREMPIGQITGKFPLENIGELKKLLPNSDAGEMLCAAAGAFFGRLLGSDSVEVGLSHPAVRKEIGGFEKLFAKFVPVRMDFDFSSSFSQAVDGISKKLNEAAMKGSYLRDLKSRFPVLGEIASEKKIEIVLDSEIDDNDRVPGIRLTFANESLFYSLKFNKALVDSITAGALAAGLETFISGIVTFPDRSLAEIPLVDDAARIKILHTWNETKRSYPTEKPVHELIEEIVAATPDALAIVSGTNTVSYGDLNKSANRMAHRLRRMGVSRETIVAVCCGRSVDSITAMLAVWKAGGAYVPLDPAYPADRLKYIADDSRASVIITNKAGRSRLPADGAATVILIDAEDLKNEKDSAVSVSVPTDALAYVIYTSGSTGQPKGVEIEHKSLLNLIWWHRGKYNVRRDDRATLVAGPAFDASVWELWPYLSAGASVYIPDEETRSAPEKLLKWLSEQRITICFLPTPVAEAMLGSRIEPDLALRHLLTGGDRLHPVGHRSLPFSLVNHYGPTENTVVSTAAEVDPNSDGYPSIGRPIDNTQAYILDRFLHPVPVGIPGDLYLSGESLGRGYLHRPELTAERFVHNPHLDCRMYKTGDLARFRPDGNIDFLGRSDLQVKIRGFRIETGEIESAMLTHDSISEAVVVALEGSDGHKKLAAFFVPQNGHSTSGSLIRDHLKATLPEYMIPAIFLPLTELPLTPNGKVDRRLLSKLAASAAPEHRHIEAGRDDTEQRLVAIWEMVLKVRPIGIRDNFFDLGGHSLQAVRMFAEVEAEFGKNVPLATLFEASTIEKLADILRQDGWTAPESSLVPIQPLGTRAPFFCIHAKGGNVLFYRDLARHLGTDQPFYGLQARRLGGRQVGHSTVEEMAEFYIKEIKAVQPKGPYHLGGSSFGGLAAFEMARQLSALGDEVGILALFDTGTPDYPRMLPGTTRLLAKIYEFVRRVQLHRDRLSAVGAKGKFDYALGLYKKASLHYRRRVRNSFKKAVRKFYLSYKGDGSIPSNYIQIEDQIWRAGQKYVPGQYSGKLTLFRASRQPLGIYPDATLGWEGLADDGIEIHEVEGHHGSIIAEPYVSELAVKLTECIAKSRSRIKHPRPIRVEASARDTLVNV